MVDKEKVEAAVKELAELKLMFEKIRADSEEFFKRSKKLSETGVHEAQELIDSAKANWTSVVASFSGSGGFASIFAKVFAKKKSKPTGKPTAKKVGTPKKAAAKAGKKSVRKTK